VPAVSLSQPLPLGSVTKKSPSVAAVASRRSVKVKRVRHNISSEQLAALEKVFAVDMFPNFDLRASLGAQLDMTPRRVQIWFQNKRAKAKKDADDSTVTEASPKKRSRSSEEEVEESDDMVTDERRPEDANSDSEFSPC